jgi:hypothetical protein
MQPCQHIGNRTDIAEEDYYVPSSLLYFISKSETADIFVGELHLFIRLLVGFLVLFTK